MLIADTSAWIEFLNGTGSPQAVRLRQGIAQREVIVVDPVVLEVMAGAKPAAADRTLRLLEAQQLEPVLPKIDWIDAATIYQEMRRRGVIIRSQIEALIAASAIRLDVPILHRDRDFDQIADHTRLAVVQT